MSNNKSLETGATPGQLYIVATPIGNLDDISKRAIATLASVDFIAAEDTRHSRRLLQHLEIDTPLIAYHDHSKAAYIEKLLDRLSRGESAALISDAGTPLVSDPGYRLVSLAREQRIPVIPIPGASALMSALCVAGLPTDRFCFEGFLPAKETARRAALESLADEPRTLVFYESPRRVLALLADLGSCMGEQRQIFLAREISKKFEQHFFGTVAGCRRWVQEDPDRQKGEFVAVLRGVESQDREQASQQQALKLLQRLRADLPLRKAVNLASELSGARKNWLYEAALKAESEKPE